MEQPLRLSRRLKVNVLPSFLCKEEAEYLISPVPHLLKSNLPPTDQERQHVRSAITSAQERLMLYRSNNPHSRPSTKGRTTTSIQRIVQLIEDFIRVHESVLSGIRLLPAELLEFIFGLSLPKYGPYLWCYASWKSHQSLCISQTCRKWRMLAISMPRLWACLAILNLRHNPKPSKKGGYSDQEFIAEILKRSGSEELRLFITSYADFRVRLGHPVLDLLLGNTHRWGAVFIRGSSDTVRKIYDSRHSFPKLRELGIKILGEPNETSSVASYPPLLTHFSICGIRDPYFYLAFRELRTYTECSFCTEGSPGNLAMVLNTCPDIEKLELFGYGYSIHQIYRVVRLPNLRVFHLTLDSNGDGWGHVFGLLDRLVLPSLETLKIGSFTESAVSCLTALIYRSSNYHSPLRSLSIINSRMYPGVLTALLRLTPELEELDVDFPPLTDLLDLIAGTAGGSASSLIPNIKWVTLRGLLKDIYGNESTVEAFTRAIFNRGAVQNKQREYDGRQTGRLRTLATSFRLVFPDSQAACDAQVSLFTWYMSDRMFDSLNEKRFKETAEVLVSLRAKLLKELPELSGEVASKKRRLNLGLSSRLNGLISECERQGLGMRGGALSLLSSKIYVTMKYLATAECGAIPGDRKYRFCARAKDILDKWVHQIHDDLAYLPWIVQDKRSLVYIPINDPIRKSFNDIDMLFGINDNPNVSSLDRSSMCSFDNH